MHARAYALAVEGELEEEEFFLKVNYVPPQPTTYRANTAQRWEGIKHA
jgi:hypothetical protein